MEIISRISQSSDLITILQELIPQKVTEYDFGLLFISSYGQEVTKDLGARIKDALKVKHFLGCSSSGIVGTSSEVEGEPACSLILGKFDHTQINPFYLDQTRLDSLQNPEHWYDFFDLFPHEKPNFIVLADPFLIDVNYFLEGINKHYADCPVIGGLASGAAQTKENVLLLNEMQYEQGIVGLAITGSVCIETVVSQGCRPIGNSYIVTKAEGNVIYELAGRPFFNVLQEVLQSADQRERSLAQDAIFLGIVMDEYKHSFKRGDFLIRMLVGIDEGTGAGAIADFVNVGQTVQFHVRDAISATEDLNALLKNQKERHVQGGPQGAIMFSCNGRGQGLFHEKNHDIGIFHKYMGDIPVTGFFCAGEIGPVGGKNFIHGFTSSIALFYPDQ